MVIVNTACPYSCVALFTRAWIEIIAEEKQAVKAGVALFTRAWIEIYIYVIRINVFHVALFTRAWIEISKKSLQPCLPLCRPLHEGVD